MRICFCNKALFFLLLFSYALSIVDFSSFELLAGTSTVSIQSSEFNQLWEMPDLIFCSQLCMSYQAESTTARGCSCRPTSCGKNTPWFKIAVIFENAVQALARNACPLLWYHNFLLCMFTLSARVSSIMHLGYPWSPQHRVPGCSSYRCAARPHRGSGDTFKLIGFCFSEGAAALSEASICRHEA